MNMKKRIMTVLIAGIAAAGAVSATLPAFAADKAADAQSRPFSLPSERIEARLAYQKTALKITSAQEAQWKTYADAQRQQASAMDKFVEQRRAAWQQRKDDKGAAPEKEKLSSTERLQKRKAFLDDAEKNLDARIALYKVLTPDQQQVADEVLGGGFGGGAGCAAHGGHHGGWERGGPDGHEGRGFGPPHGEG